MNCCLTPRLTGTAAGKGAFGVVRLVIEKATGKLYACKSISKAKIISREDVDDVRREVSRHRLIASCSIAGLINTNRMLWLTGVPC
jgi:calcium-dependent protein kinase